METNLATYAPIPAQATSDDQLIALWLHGRPAGTARVYRAALDRFVCHVDRIPIRRITLGDLQGFVDTLGDLAPNSRRRMIASIKSLLTFAHRIGYVPFNVGAALKLPPAKSELAERILTEEQIVTMIARTPNERDRVLLRLLYASAGRVSEIAGLTWADVQPNGDTGQIVLYGKGGKTRSVKLPAGTWAAIRAYRNGGQGDQPVFVSRNGRALSTSQIHRIVKRAAIRAGIEGNVSAHWLRHSHASHALDRGASVALVRDTLGHSSLAVTSRYTHAKPSDSSALHLIV